MNPMNAIDTMNSMNATSGASPGSAQVHYARRWPALFVLLAAWFMNLLDVSIMNVALPSLQNGLHASDSAIQWVLEIYILTYALCLLPFGRLGDIVGRKGMFAAGVGVFTTASVFCGAAPSVEALIAARGLQGLGAAMMSPQVMAIAQTMFPPKDRARAFPLFGLTAGLAAISGPLASGLLLHANFFGLGWRLIFLVNLPIGLLTIAAALAIVPRSPKHEGLRNDWLGIGLAAAAILCLIFPLVEGRTHEWPLWCFVAIAAFAPLLAAFVAWERFQAKSGGSALLPIYLMSNRDYLIGAGAILVYCSALQGFFVVFAIFLQGGLQFTPLQAGLATAPFPVGVLAATIVSGRIASLKAKIMGGALLLVGAFGALPFIVDRGGPAWARRASRRPCSWEAWGPGCASPPCFRRSCGPCRSRTRVPAPAPCRSSSRLAARWEWRWCQRFSSPRLTLGRHSAFTCRTPSSGRSVTPRFISSVRFWWWPHPRWR
jgi:MFS family permease